MTSTSLLLFALATTPVGPDASEGVELAQGPLPMDAPVAVDETVYEGPVQELPPAPEQVAEMAAEEQTVDVEASSVAGSFSIAPLASPSMGGAPSLEGRVETLSFEKKDQQWGVLVDAGVPDGVGASIGYRPLTWLRFQLGGMSNTFAAGIRGGVSVVPFNTFIRPSLTLEGGHYFPGDAGKLLGGSGNAQTAALLSNISYDFANGHAGFELGSRRVAFFLRGGLSYIEGNVPGIQGALATQSSTITAQAAKLRMTAPSAKLGFAIFFL